MAEKEVGTLRTKLSWEDKNATRSLTGFKQDLKGLRSEMNLAKSKGQEYTNSLKGLREQSDILTRRFKTQKEEVKELNKRYQEAARVKSEDDKATKNLADKYRNATAQMNRTESQLNKVTDEIEEQINPWKRLGRNAEIAGDKMQSVGRGMTNFGRNMTMGVSVPMAVAGGAVFKLAMDFESAFTGVEKTVEGTEQQLGKLRSGIREMAKEVPATTTEIAAVAEAAGQLGIQTESIEDFTKTMIDLGEATNLTSNQASTQFARFANIVGMRQDDFDKLGSVIVDLGNNLATTESEISEMALRLAGAGKQIGLTESDILAFSGALSSVGIRAEAGGSAFSKVMVNMQLAAEKGGKSLDNFAKVAGVSSSEFQKAYEKDATGAIMAFIEGLSTAEDRGLSAIGILDEMGIKEVRLRDTLLRAAGATDVFSDALNIGSKAWEENIALTEEAEKRYATTESQLKIMWNRIKDVAITLGGALVPAVMDALDAAEPLIEKIESGAQAFTEMNEEEQQTILKMIAFAAAIGPVSLVLGGLTSTLGGVAKGVGGVAGLLGKAGGAGLLARLGGLGVAGPVGLAIAGVVGLGAAMHYMTNESDRSLEETLKMIETRKKEIDSTDKLIKQYETLRLKNSLSTDETLRYMDIMSELKDAKSEETIKKLTDEQSDLLKKSGLTNDEMDRFLKLNGDVVDKTPEANKVISDQGNAYAGVADELKILNDAKRDQLTDETYIALTSELEKQRDRLAEQKELKQDLSVLEDEQVEKLELLSNKTKLVKDLDLKIVDLKKDMKTASEKELPVLQEKLEKAEHDRRIQGFLLEADRKHFTNLLERIGKKEEEIGLNEDELKQFGRLKGDYAQMVLYEQGIVSEKGKANEAIRTEQKEIDTANTKLKKLWDTGKITRAEYEKQSGELKEQQRKIDIAKGKLQEMNEVAGKTIYKGVNIKTDPSVSSLDRELGRDVTKNVSTTTTFDSNYRSLTDPAYKTLNIITSGGGYQARPQFAEGGTHKGGEFIAGEEGYEIGKMGNNFELLNAGIYNRPAGYQVFDHDDSKRVLSAINNMPAYASGVGTSGEADRIVNRLNGQQPQNLQGEAVIYTTVINKFNGREVSREIHKDITEFQNREKEVRDRFAT